MNNFSQFLRKRSGQGRSSTRSCSPSSRGGISSYADRSFDTSSTKTSSEREVSQQLRMRDILMSYFALLSVFSEVEDFLIGSGWEEALGVLFPHFKVVNKEGCKDASPLRKRTFNPFSVLFSCKEANF